MHIKEWLFAVLVVILPITLNADTGIERKEGTYFNDKIRDYSEGEIRLLPDFSFSESIRQNIVEHGTVFLVEFLYQLPQLPGQYDSLRSLIDLFLDIESLEGIEYWSGGRGRMYPYIKKSYRVESSGSRKYLPPLTWPDNAESLEFYQYQIDTSFGTNWYQIHLEMSDDAILMKTLNLSDLKALTKKTADAEGVLLQMAIIPGESKTILYCVVALKEFPAIGWSQQGIAGSFNHRISALEAWFADRVYK